MRTPIAALAAALALTAPATAAADTTPTWAAGDKCLEHESFVHGDEAAVAARLPKRYTVVRESDQPLLFARAVRCEHMAIGGRTQPVTFAMFGIVVEQTGDERGCSSGTPAGEQKGDFPPACNLYSLGWYASDPRLTEWLPFGAKQTTDLVFELGADDPEKGGAPFHFASPGFRIDAVGRERPGTIPIRRTYFEDTPNGVAMLRFSTDDLAAGAASGTVSADPGSEMATLMGATEQPYAGPYGSFATEHFDHGIYRRQLSTNEGFKGTCELKGDVTFDPPATYADQPLHYAYDATGTCDGSPKGPIHLHQEGLSYGSCNAAHTTSPGDGAFTFASGQSFGYTLDFATNATEVDATFYGLGQGTARVHGTFLTDRTPPDVLANCAGAGTKTTPLDITIKTESPLGGTPPRGEAPAPPPPSGDAGTNSGTPPRATRPRLRLRVIPRRGRAGRRTRFTFRVTTNDGRPVAGALVRFAGRRARTGARGRARITTTIRRRGRRTARASLPGAKPARATIRIRRP
jgi:hypothetical protein